MLSKELTEAFTAKLTEACEQYINRVAAYTNSHGALAKTIHEIASCDSISDETKDYSMHMVCKFFKYMESGD